MQFFHNTLIRYIILAVYMMVLMVLVLFAVSHNDYVFRSRKPYDNHPQFAIGHVDGPFTILPQLAQMKLY